MMGLDVVDVAIGLYILDMWSVLCDLSYAGGGI